MKNHNLGNIPNFNTQKETNNEKLNWESLFSDWKLVSSGYWEDKDEMERCRFEIDQEKGLLMGLDALYDAVRKNTGLKYLDRLTAEKYGFEKITKENGDEYYYREGFGIWIFDINGLHRYLDTWDDDELRVKGYAVDVYYFACFNEAINAPDIHQEEEINLFNFEYETVKAA